IYKPGWLPDFLWSETFPRNILGPERQPVNVLEYMDCPPGADGVYPAMLYEFLMAVILFVVLWKLRIHRHAAGWLFGIYLVLAGLERFLIEQIRVNNVGTFLGVQATQAEVISVVLVLIGVVLALKKRKRKDQDMTTL